MPKYMALIYGQDETEPEFLQSVMADYIEFGDAATAAGVIVDGGALQPTSTATTVTVRGGKGGDVITTDGPYAETKEILGGYYLLECKDLDEALHWASRIPGAWHGMVEVRPLVTF